MSVGETDSDSAFCMLLERMANAWRGGSVPSIDNRFEIVAAFAEELRAFGPANFLYSDGEALFACGHRRFNSLSQKVEPPGLTTITPMCTAEQPEIAVGGLNVDSSARYVTLIASVPLSDGA